MVRLSRLLLNERISEALAAEPDLYINVQFPFDAFQVGTDTIEAVLRGPLLLMAIPIFGTTRFTIALVAMGVPLASGTAVT